MIYIFNRYGAAQDFATKVAQFTARFNSNPRLKNNTLNDIIVNDDEIQIDISGTLNRKESQFLKILVNNIFSSGALNDDEDSVNQIDSDTKPTSNDDYKAGFRVGTTWTNTTTGLIYRCTQCTPGDAIWLNVSGDSQVIYATDTNYYLNHPMYTKSTSWMIVSQFPYRYDIDFNLLQCVVKLDNSATIGQIEIVNNSNGQVIADLEFTGSTYASGPTYIEHDTFNNIPTENTILILRLKRKSGKNANVYIHSFRLS